ncbi:MAG TPA: hypothetical protein VF605_12500 [Allosphingosinicella sp.]|jgi:hypothetical protein
MTTHPFPVLCDRCRAEGLAGEAEFAALAGLGDLLDFEPVARRKRANGWDSEAQRAFIAVLAVTGSDRQAAAVVGRNAFGITQLCKAENNEGFLAARAKAMEIFEEKERVRRSDGLLAAVRGEETRARARHRPAWSDAATRRLPPPPGQEVAAALEPDPDEDGHIPADALEVICAIVHKYRLKLEAERRCRLEGRIAEADFYLRQITMLEVSLDVVSGNGMEVLKRARLGDHGLLTIAETGWSVMLDNARRRFWEAMGEPPRPEYPPRHLLEQQQGYATEPLDATWGGLPEGHQEQRRALEEQHARDALAQVEWEQRAREEVAAWRARQEAEAEARRDHERRQGSRAANDQEPGDAGEPAPEGRED